jgi:hypothetical protein
MPKRSIAQEPGHDPLAEKPPRYTRRRPAGPQTPPHAARPPKKARTRKADRDGPSLEGTSQALNNILINNIYREVVSIGDVKKDNVTDSQAILRELDDIIKEIDIRAKKLSIQELKFLELHLVKGETIKRAMLLAGYEIPKVEGTLYWRAKRIIRKLEMSAADHRAIMRAVGAGEVAVTAGLFALARSKDTPAVARVAAYTTLAKMLGMEKDIIQGTQGVTIVIQGPDGQEAALRPAPPGAPGLPAADPLTRPPGKPIQITD